MNPPPPPPHGENPKSSGLPNGKYDIFIIPEHSAGSGFLYLPSLKPNVNSFAAGFASALILVVVGSALAPAVQAWWNSVKGAGGAGMIMLMLAVGVGAWALGRIQTDGGPGPGGGGTSGPSSNSGPHPNAHSSSHSNGYAGPPPGTGPMPGAGPMPGGGAGGPMPGGPKPSSWQRPPPGATSAAGGGSPGGSGPNTSTNGSAGAGGAARSAWEKAREETKKKQEENRAREAEKKRKEELEKRLREAREKEAREREAREAKKREEDTRQARQKAEEDAREAKKKADEAKKRAEETQERDKKRREEEALDKKRRDLEILEKRLKDAREREARERLAREQKKKDDEEASKPRGSTYAFSAVGEKTNPWPRGRPVTPEPPRPNPPSPTKRPPPPTARTYRDAEEDTHSYRPYDKPKKPMQHKKSLSSLYSESSYAASHSTSRTTPPPSHRGPYSTKDPDKIVIKAVYSFNNAFLRTPTSQLVSGVGPVTDGLILRITTEGLFIDDDVRGVPQREWDVKAWTMKLVETGELKTARLHVLRASIRDQEGKKYVFVVPEEESWKVAIGLQRLRKGTQVRALGVSGMSAGDARSTLENLGWGN
ncbi:hypothetical protein DL98DRAFT_568678 [Cadophora sp. DSE1049]|nr:hypothetical protein DL98DRAFT_568678 [Cadophora sp. DSE1049]